MSRKEGILIRRTIFVTVICILIITGCTSYSDDKSKEEKSYAIYETDSNHNIEKKEIKDIKENKNTKENKDDKENNSQKDSIEIKKIDESENDKYKIKDGEVYYVLVDEYLMNEYLDNDAFSMFTRQYFCYDGIKNNATPFTDVVGIAKVGNIVEAKKHLEATSPDSLKLMENTIVSEYVKDKWEKETKYDNIDEDDIEYIVLQGKCDDWAVYAYRIRVQQDKVKHDNGVLIYKGDDELIKDIKFYEFTIENQLEEGSDKSYTIYNTSMSASGDITFDFSNNKKSEKYPGIEFSINEMEDDITRRYPNKYKFTDNSIVKAIINMKKADGSNYLKEFPLRVVKIHKDTLEHTY